jgi:long-chain acyl-CoA synthetase
LRVKDKQQEKKPLEVLLMRMEERKALPAIFWQGKEYTYGELFDRIVFWEQLLQERGVTQGTICGILGDYSFETISLLFALMKKNAIIVPFYKNPQQELDKLIKIAEVQELFDFEDGNVWTIRSIPQKTGNNIIKSFISQSHPGLVIFTSGSTGEPKGILHDCHLVIKKFLEPGKPWRTILFLLFDHFGGINTLFSVFASGGMAICLKDRSPSNVCESIEKAKATLLPTSPSFLNILLLSGNAAKYDLASIELITYGTEVMAPSLLEKIPQLFPQTKLKQTYGLSELGVLRSKSQQESSTWVKIGGEGFTIKVIDNTLWIQSEYNMVGYLNAPSPFDEEGWMCTGDQVEVQGEYLRILGRQSDLINVGGQKVFPAEVESVLQEDENVKDALVYGKPSPVMGEMVCAKVLLKHPEKKEALKERLRKLCLQKLARYKMPIHISFASEEEFTSIRFKKIRK